MTLTLRPVPNIPMIQPGENLAGVIFQSLQAMPLPLEDGDILVAAQKIVSKAEGRLFNLNAVQPSALAEELAVKTEKDPRFIELVLRESNEVLRVRPGTIIVEHKQGFVCANAGIDHSNVRGPGGNPEDWVLLLPENPDASAERIRLGVQELSQQSTGKAVNIGVIIIDSHGRAWRNGVVGVTIGLSNVPGVVDMRGEEDLYGYKLRVTTIAAADELAAAASLVMGQAAECTPVIHTRGFPYALRQAHFAELVRAKELDLFR